MPARNFQMQPSGHPSRKPAPSAQRTSEGSGSFAGTVNGGSEPFLIDAAECIKVCFHALGLRTASINPVLKSNFAAKIVGK